MDDIGRRRIECILDTTEEYELLRRISSFDENEYSQVFEQHNKNTDVERSMCSFNTDGNISNDSDSEYIYHEYA